MTAARSDLMALADKTPRTLRTYPGSVDAREAVERFIEAALSAPVGEPYAYHYERATATTNSGKPALWQNELSFGKPDTHEYIRNVVPLYTHPPAPAVGPDVREALEGLLRKSKEKREQVAHYRVALATLDHAKTIADGRILQLDQVLDWIEAALTRPLGGFVQGSIARKQSTDTEGSSRTETAGGEG